MFRCLKGKGADDTTGSARQELTDQRDHLLLDHGPWPRAFAVLANSPWRAM